jgi:tRNA-specific 2-thiouridylase
MQGRVLGRHEGTIGFTVGQRRGLGIGGSPEPLYVVAVDPGAARVTVGPREALARREIDVGGFNWIGGGTPPAELDDVAVRVRSTAAPAQATLRFGPEPGRARIGLAVPEFAIAAGQAAVVQRGERILGGGWIRRAEQAPRTRPARLDTLASERV